MRTQQEGSHLHSKETGLQKKQTFLHLDLGCQSSTSCHRYTKVKSEWIIELNVRRATTIKHLGENIGENLHDLGQCVLGYDIKSTREKRKKKLS